MIRKLLFLISALTVLLMSACRKEFGKPSWDADFLAPVANGTLSINNIFKDGNGTLQTNADSSLKLVFEKEFYSFNIDSLFTIPDTVIHQKFNIPIPFTLMPGQQILNNNISETTYGLQGVQLKKVILEKGSVNYTIKSLVREVTDFTYSIPCAKLNGVPFSINVQVPAATNNGPGVYSFTFDLSGYEFDLTGIQHNKVNTLYTSLTVAVSQQGQSVLVYPADSIVIDNTFSNILPYYAKGYFGQNTINIGPEESNFDAFKKIVDGTISLQDVNVNMRLENYIGMDARAYIDNINSVNTASSNTVSLSGAVVGSAININRAADNNGNVTPSIINIPINASNSNITQLLENLPDKLAYIMRFISNPLGNISGSNDFVYADKLVNAKLNIEVPLSLIANNLTLQDTLQLNIAEDNVSSSLNSGTITLYANNGFPLDAAIQVYLLDENKNIADSVFGYINHIDEAPLNGNLRATQKKLTKLVVPFSTQKKDLLFRTKQLVLKVKFDTASKPNYIKLYQDYNIEIKLVADFNYTITIH
jgi:hypothetical protein